MFFFAKVTDICPASPPAEPRVIAALRSREGRATW